MNLNAISVIGLGYIGLPTAAMFASKGMSVIGVDTNQLIVDTINKGEIHIIEPDLETLVHSAVRMGTLKSSITPLPADAFLIAVPTPLKKSQDRYPKPDLSFIKKAVSSIAPLLKKGNLIILESTSPVGTTEKISRWLSEARKDLSFPHQISDLPDINIAYCPERVLPGHIIHELVENDRIIGGLSNTCSDKAKKLYEIFVQGECIVTNARTAEMTKLTENSCRDVQIAFANELSMICDEKDINVWELISLANRHPRVNILQPGPGVGGHCIAVDPWFIVNKSPKKSKLIKTARKVNIFKEIWVEEKISLLISEMRKRKTHWPEVRFWGLSFKPDIDDLRESPALRIVEKFSKYYLGDIKVIEPNINKIPDTINEKAELVNFNTVDCKTGLDVILVNHSKFKGLDFGALALDTRGNMEFKK